MVLFSPIPNSSVFIRSVVKNPNLASFVALALEHFLLVLLLNLQLFRGGPISLLMHSFLREKFLTNILMRKIFATKVFSMTPLFFLFFFFFLHASSESDIITAPMEKTEQEALYLVIQGFVGKGWNGSGLYPDPCGWTPIQGVSCDLFEGLWYVTVLNIGPVLDNSLECAPDANFSPYLFELRHLRTISIFDCFSKPTDPPTTIPAQNWQNLAGSLQTLELRSNHGLTGVIPESLGLLTGLQSLVLVENALMGQLPPRLGNLLHLRRLSLSGNRFSGPIPASLGSNLSELLILDLSSNSLTGPILPSLGNMSSLLKLDLSNNNLDGKLPRELGKLRNVTLLDLRNNRLAGGWAQSLQGMVSLEDMLLSNNPFGGNLTEFEWEELRNLTNLDLSKVGLTGKIPESITRLRRLRFLALDNNCLFGSVTPKLEDLPSLNALYLNGNNLTGELGFSAGFYQRMGRRFASWNNPHLCYMNVGVAAAATGSAPHGVEQCKPEER